jgi:hypothetical protein
MRLAYTFKVRIDLPIAIKEKICVIRTPHPLL